MTALHSLADRVERLTWKRLAGTPSTRETPGGPPSLPRRLGGMGWDALRGGGGGEGRQKNPKLWDGREAGQSPPVQQFVHANVWRTQNPSWRR